MLDCKVVDRVVRESVSEVSVCDAVESAVCWDERWGRAEVFWEMAVWRFAVRVDERVERRASFSGLRGIGGAGRWEGLTGREMSKGESRRLGGGAGLGLGCGCCGGESWCCCGCCCVGCGACCC